MNQIFDVIIIGAGPAGLTAGIYTSRREMKTLIIGQVTGGQVVWASMVENYPGFKKINNIELITKWQEHTQSLGVNIEQKEVKEIKKKDELFVLYTGKDTLRAKTVIIAMGLTPRRLAIPGEERLTGRGISYCANCDGPFYRNKIVAVNGGGNSALDAAEMLSKIARQVYLIHRRKDFRGFETLVNEVKKRPNIELVLDSEITEIKGESQIEKIKIINNKNKKSSELSVDGLFIEIGRIAHTDLVADLVERNRNKQIIVDEKCRTKTPGLFAAGDVTHTPFKQITIAMGQATTAALAAYEFLQLSQGKGSELIRDRGSK